MGPPAALLLALTMGCSDDETEPGGVPDDIASPCARGEAPSAGGGCCPAGTAPQDDGSCLPAGLPPDMLCPPGELEYDGACLPAGVPPEACGDGFEPDGEGGCNAILPPEPCAEGTMAVPGETVCRPVADCGTGTWGSIPTEASTQFVDESYAGGNSDGSEGSPWTTVQEGVDEAAEGAIVAVAAGSYAEDVRIAGKSVQLWGRCPDMVEIVGQGGQQGAVRLVNAGGTEIRSLAIRGASEGILATTTGTIVVDSVWIHDTASLGLVALDASNGPVDVSLTASLIEETRDTGVYLSGVVATVDSTVVRRTQTGAWQVGRGIVIQDDATTGTPASVVVRRSVVEQSVATGILTIGSAAVLDRTVVRDTQALAGAEGDGLVAQPSGEVDGRSSIGLRAVVVERNHGIGIFLTGSDAAIEATTVKDTLPGDGKCAGAFIQDLAEATVHSSSLSRNHYRGAHVSGANATFEATIVHDTQTDDGEQSGFGLSAEDNLTVGVGANVILRGSLIEGNHGAGVEVAGSSLLMEASAVRDTRPNPATGYGTGLHVQPSSDTGARGSLTVRRSLVEQSRALGVSISGSDGVIESTIVRATQSTAQGTFGRAIGVQHDGSTGHRGSLLLRSALLDQNAEFGIFLAGVDATIEATEIRDTLPEGTGEFGRGINIRDHDTVHRSVATIRSTRIVGCQEAGVFVLGSDVTIDSSIVQDARANGEDRFGDGLDVFSFPDGEPAILHLSNVWIGSSARAGLASFGGHTTLESTTFECNTIDLDGEGEYYGMARPFVFEDGGALVCGCGPESRECGVQSSSLEPPSPVTADNPTDGR